MRVISTIVVMHTFQAAQPALLYLSPACILSILLTALARGETTCIWTYSDEEEKPEDSKKGENGKKLVASPEEEVVEEEGKQERTNGEAIAARRTSQTGGTGLRKRSKEPTAADEGQ